jgi:signal transduction histidine kinase
VGEANQEQQLRRLLDVGRSLVGELDPDAVLDRILTEACEITGARYAALGVLNQERSGLERFVTRGIDETTHRAIGALPRGHGVLGVLIDDPRPLRLADVGQHPKSYGFPAAHPPMKGFLGVPIPIRGEAWGNLYLTEKEGSSEFTEQDEEAATLLAQWAGIAIENARLYVQSERGRAQAERAARALEAARDIADAVGGIAELDRVLELVVKRGRALVDARTVLIMLREGEELVVAASAGHASNARGRRIPVVGSTSGEVLQRGHPVRIADVASELQIAVQQLGVEDAQTGLLVPLLRHNRAIGVLAAFDHGPGSDEFSAGDEDLLRSFAGSAANAVVLNQSVEADRLRAAIEAADAERGRWSRELHDETLQSLGGLRVLLASAVRHGDRDVSDQAMHQAISDIEEAIDALRAIISDLRPTVLDDLGLEPAIEALLDRRRQTDLSVVTELAALRQPLPRELETTIYRLIQEALSNVVKHARASSVHITATADGGYVSVEVRDDGVGFNTKSPGGGFGLAGIRERVYLAGGRLELESTPEGTVVRARIPNVSSAEAASDPDADQIARST